MHLSFSLRDQPLAHVYLQSRDLVRCCRPNVSRASARPHMTRHHQPSFGPFRHSSRDQPHPRFPPAYLSFQSKSVRARQTWIFSFHRCRVHGPSLNFLNPLLSPSLVCFPAVVPSAPLRSLQFLILRLNASPDPALDPGYDLTLCLCKSCTPSLVQVLGDLMDVRNTWTFQIRHR
jgi:hypothetical protein